jgi:hypothetical protein
MLERKAPVDGCEGRKFLTRGWDMRDSLPESPVCYPLTGMNSGMCIFLTSFWERFSEKQARVHHCERFSEKGGQK